jgi:hypothetical protein
MFQIPQTIIDESNDVQVKAYHFSSRLRKSVFSGAPRKKGVPLFTFSRTDFCSVRIPVRPA